MKVFIMHQELRMMGSDTFKYQWLSLSIIITKY